MYTALLLLGVSSLAVSASDALALEKADLAKEQWSASQVAVVPVAASAASVSVSEARNVPEVAATAFEASEALESPVEAVVLPGEFPADPVIANEGAPPEELVVPLKPEPTESPVEAPVEEAVPVVVEQPAVDNVVESEPEPVSDVVSIDYGQRFEVGDPIGLLTIPAIDLEWVAVQGVDDPQLDVGPGHYLSTPLPGQPGNAALAGHRTSHGGPFLDLDRLVPGDLVVFEDRKQIHTYEVTGSQIVTPSDTWVVETTSFAESTLTLTTCHPKGSTKQRLVVSAVLLKSEALEVAA